MSTESRLLPYFLLKISFFSSMRHLPPQATSREALLCGCKDLCSSPFHEDLAIEHPLALVAKQVCDSDSAGCGGGASILCRQDRLRSHQSDILSFQPHPRGRVHCRVPGKPLSLINPEAPWSALMPRVMPCVMPHLQLDSLAGSH